MRITGGEAKGRVLSAFKGLRIRPTSDHVREAIFSILGQDFRGKRVLDLFAGTGSLGLEALSRGAIKAVFVDVSPRAIELIRKNLEICSFTNRAVVCRKDLKKGLPPVTCMGGGIGPFHVVFMDPPYRAGLVSRCIVLLLQKGALANEAVVVAETHKSERLPQEIHGLNLVDQRTYGDTKINFFEWSENND